MNLNSESFGCKSLQQYLQDTSTVLQSHVPILSLVLIKLTRKFPFTAYSYNMGDQNNYDFPIPTQNVSMYDDIARYVRISQGV